MESRNKGGWDIRGQRKKFHTYYTKKAFAVILLCTYTGIKSQVQSTKIIWVKKNLKKKKDKDRKTDTKFTA